MAAINAKKERLLSRERLLELMEYNPDTGEFIRKTNRSNQKAGEIAGTLSNGYIYINIDYKIYRAHRLAWFYMTGEWPTEHIDHINHCRSDNRFCNLRVVTNTENHKNKIISKYNTSGVTGVGWYKALNKWRAYINVNRKQKHLGFFDDFDDAVKARKAALKKYNYHPNHGNPGNE